MSYTGGTSINIEAGRMKLFALTAQYLAVSFKVKECIYDVVHYFYSIYSEFICDDK